jgi:hypothetical protein
MAAAMALHRCLEDLGAARSGALVRSRRLLAQELQLREFERALESLDSLESLRPGLLFLAVSTSSNLTADFVIAVDRARLTEYARALLGRLATRTWSEYDTAAELATGAGDPDFPVELDAILTRHLGEVGRDPLAMEDLLLGGRPLAELRQEVIAMNREYLHYPAASTRVRAFDWLKVRELEPPGYDPLGPAATRRAALTRFEEALEEERERATPRPIR